jgi:hypothetical protein
MRFSSFLFASLVFAGAATATFECGADPHAHGVKPYHKHGKLHKHKRPSTPKKPASPAAPQPQLPSQPPPRSKKGKSISRKPKKTHGSKPKAPINTKPLSEQPHYNAPTPPWEHGSKPGWCAGAGDSDLPRWDDGDRRSESHLLKCICRSHTD